MALTLIADTAGLTGTPHADEHQPAQDYAASLYTNHGLAVVVCDGCSHGEVAPDDPRHKLGIGYHTDVGARLLAHATLAAVKAVLPTLAEATDRRRVLRDAIQRAQHAAMYNAMVTLDLNEGDLTATWLCAVVLPDGRYDILGEGDGAYALRSATSLKLVNYDWVRAPFYPVFRLQDWDNVVRAFGGVDAAALRITQSGDCEHACEELAFGDALERGIGESGVLAAGEDIILSSDGIHRFVNKLTQQKMPPENVLNMLGGWMDKRGNRKVRSAMTISMRRLLKDNWRVLDDFTLAVISALVPKDTVTEDVT